MAKLVILGGGYGGYSVMKHLLDERIPAGTEILLIDRMPFQGLKTEYYALAAGTVSEFEIRVQFPQDTPHLQLKYGNVNSVDLDRKLVHMDNEEPVAYDNLVIALGCTDKYHGIPGADLYSHSIQSLSSTRKTYLDINEVKPYGQVTIVGGGLSGVEMAAELRESRADLNIRILDRGPSILSAFPERAQDYVRSWFEGHDVEMRSHICIQRLEQGVVYNMEEQIHTDVTIWTAGIQPSPIVQQLNLNKDNQGRILLNEWHQIPEYTDVYVVGDCASLPFSPSAQAAGAQGSQVADVIAAIWNGENPRLGKIKLKGVLGSLGKNAGFGLMGKRSLVGKIPRILKSGVLWKSKHHFG